MLYSKLVRGFFSEASHGARKITIVEPSWQRPLIDVDLPPGETLQAELNGELHVVENDTDGVMRVSGVPDMSVIAPTIEIDNPECKIPVDATDESKWDYTYAELITGQSKGKLIDGDENGYPILVDPPAPTAADLARAQILEIEETITPRRMREATLTEAGRAWLVERDAEIAALRARL